MNVKEINTTALAYIGDAVYEIYVRTRVLESSGDEQLAYGAHVDALHKRAIKYVKASGQAKAVKKMLAGGFLSPDEEALVRRARNHKTASKPKNADAMDYKYATAFEALIGYLHLTGENQRKEEIIQQAFTIIDAK